MDIGLNKQQYTIQNVWYILNLLPELCPDSKIAVFLMI